MRRFVSFLEDPVAAVRSLRGYGDVAAVVADNPAIVCVFGPELNRRVLSDPAAFHNPEDFFTGPPGSARDKMRSMVVTSNGALHRRNRRLLMPAFQRAALDGYAADIVSLTRDLLAGWSLGRVVAIDDLCRELALCVAVKCFYGVDVKAGAAELGRTMAEFVRIITSPANILLPVNLPGFPFHRGVRLGEELAARMLELVEDKRRRGGEQRDAIGLLLSARDDEGRRLSQDEIVALAVELFIAGSETTAVTIAWTLLLLDQHPAELDAVCAELDAVLGVRDPEPADLARLEHLDRAVKETMRVLPTAPVLFLRKLAEDTVLQDIALPRGANVAVSPLVTHHDPALYPLPRRFLPERWRTLDPPAYTYMPFGAGPRTCAGALFGAQAVRLVLAMVLRRFRPRAVEGARIDRLVRGNILHARHGLHMRLASGAGPAAPAAQVRGDIRDLVDLPHSRAA